MRTACLRGEKSEKRVKNFSSYPKTKQQTRKVSLGFLGTESAKQEVGQGVRAVRCVRDQTNKKNNRSLCKHWQRMCAMYTQIMEYFTRIASIVMLTTFNDFRI